MRIIFSLALIFLLITPFAANAEEFTVLAPPYPPYSISKGLTVTGMSISALNAIMASCGHPLSAKAFKLTPWPFAYEYAARYPQRIVVNARRTRVNEPLYKWVGPITNSRIVLYGRKKDGLSTPLSPEDLGKYRIATVRWSRPERILLDGGISKRELIRTATHVTSLRKLGRGEVDLFAADERGAPALFKGLGMNPDDYQVCHVFKEEPLYFAFSRDTDDRLIARLNEALTVFNKKCAEGASPFIGESPDIAAP